MKKAIFFLTVILILGMITPAFAEVSDIQWGLSDQKVVLDGKRVNIGAYNIEDENYFKLRDLAAILKNTDAKFNVEYDEEEDIIHLTTKKAYTPVDGDLEALPKGDPTILPSPQKVLIDGEEAEIKAYNVNDNNYYRLRDLGDLLGFGVAFNGKTLEVMISSKGELEDIPGFEDREVVPKIRGIMIYGDDKPDTERTQVYMKLNKINYKFLEEKDLGEKDIEMLFNLEKEMAGKGAVINKLKFPVTVVILERGGEESAAVIIGYQPEEMEQLFFEENIGGNES